METKIKLSELPEGSIFTHSSIPHQWPLKKCNTKTMLADGFYPKETGIIAVTTFGEYFFNPDEIVTTEIHEGFMYMAAKLKSMNIRSAIEYANC